VYTANCVACHQATGKGLEAMKAPALAGNKVVTGSKQEPIDTVLNGRPNTAMQPFKQLSDAEIAAVLTYVRSSWGNKASDVQPAEVKARRK
jgi:cytochrome c oxidase subunit 2